MSEQCARYGRPKFRALAEQMHAWAGVTGTTVRLVPAADQDFLGGVQRPFDLVLLDHEKRRYAPTLAGMENSGLLSEGALVVADNVVVFSSTQILRTLRFSGAFDDYRLYWSELEYDSQHGRPGEWGPFPDGRGSSRNPLLASATEGATRGGKSSNLETKPVYSLQCIV